MLPAPDPTFSLMLATLRWPDDVARRSAIAHRASAAIDWKRFLALASRHRASPLAIQGLISAEIALPAWTSTQLEDARKHALFGEMTIARRLEQLQQRLADGAIQAIALKGPALSLRAFGQLGLRTYRDLDLLVNEADLASVGTLLIEDGYEFVEPSPRNSTDLSAWAKDHKDMVLRHPLTGQLIEVHWRLFDNRALMPVRELSSPVRLGLAPLEASLVLPADVELRYLCLHGALHGWSRLRWLADINAMIAHVPRKSMPAIIRSADGRISPAVSQALILCRELLGAVFPPDIDRILARSRRGRWLARLAWSEILRSGTEELEAVHLGSTVKNLSHYALLDDARSLFEEVRFDLTAKPRLNMETDRQRGRVLDWITRHLGKR